MSATLVDALLALVILLSAWAGVRRGFVFAAIQLATLLASLALALVCYEWLSAWLAEFFPAIGVWSSPASFLIVFIAAHIVLGALGRRFAVLLPARFHQHVANRTLGVVPGAVNGLINALLFAMLLQTTPLTETISAAARESEFAQSLDEPAGWVEAQLTPIFEPAIRGTLRNFTVAADP
ncbi:MAG: CvpA family protein, partial [Ramlibacter sp.]|nr:CvpA family protein [Ramlibacter sp.]